MIYCLPGVGQVNAEGIFTYRQYIIDADLSNPPTFGDSIVLSLSAEGMNYRAKGYDQSSWTTNVILYQQDSLFRINDLEKIIQVPSPEIKEQWIAEDSLAFHPMTGQRIILGYPCQAILVTQILSELDWTLQSTVWYTPDIQFHLSEPSTMMYIGKVPGFPLYIEQRIDGYDMVAITEILSIDLRSIPSETFQGPEGYQIVVLYPEDPCNRK